MDAERTCQKRDIDGQIIWEAVEEEATPMEAPDISFDDLPVDVPHRKRKSRTMTKRRRLASCRTWRSRCGKEPAHRFAHGLPLESDPAARCEPPLRDDVDCRLVNSEIQKLEPSAAVRPGVLGTDEAYRTTYELIRQNKMPESETMLARLLNALFGEGKKGVTRDQKIDGSQLPEYSSISRYLGPTGFQATTESDGWFLKGFTLTKKADRENSDEPQGDDGKSGDEKGASKNAADNSAK